MSVRVDDLVSHVCVRGTHVSTSMWAPSRLHAHVLEGWGMPNARNVTVVDDVTVYIRWDLRDPDVLYAWARAPEPPSEADTGAVPFPLSRCQLM